MREDSKVKSADRHEDLFWQLREVYSNHPLGIRLSGPESWLYKSDMGKWLRMQVNCAKHLEYNTHICVKSRAIAGVNIAAQSRARLRGFMFAFSTPRSAAIVGLRYNTRFRSVHEQEQ
jgi:hypothetical protein